MAAVESEIRAAERLRSMAGAPESEGYLELLYRLYPVIVITIYTLAALICSVRTSGTADDVVAPTVRGPGGKPLPMTKKKKRHNNSSRRLSRADLFEIGPRARFVFRLLAVILTTTLFMNAMAIGVHTWRANPNLLEREGGMNWWCGEPMVVSGCLSVCYWPLATKHNAAAEALLHAIGPAANMQAVLDIHRRRCLRVPLLRRHPVRQ